MLKRVRSVFGRFHGLYEGTTFLELVKVKEMVKDPSGKKQVQWLVTIELSQDVDPMDLCNHNESAVVRGISSIVTAGAISSVSSELAADANDAGVDETDTTSTGTGLSVNEIKNKIKELAEKHDIKLGHMYTYCSSLANGVVFAKINDLKVLESIYTKIVDGIEYDKDLFKTHCSDLFDNKNK